MRPPHGNSRRSEKKHHLYEIYDREDNDVYKYGISGESLSSEGASRRADRQVSLFNRVVGWFRFFANVLVSDIPGRSEAERIEREHIDSYARKNGRRPRGNP